MGIQSIQGLAFAGLITAAIMVAVETTPSTKADVCVLPTTAADSAAIEFAAMFRDDSDRVEASLFNDAPLFIYAVNEVARESDGVTLVDVSDVTSCAHHKNII
jgi:hypothetical protein